MEYLSWARLLRRGTTGRQRAVSPLDASTSLLQAFEPALIPGLLQTAEYARHVLHSIIALQDIPNDAREGVQARLDRQTMLYEPHKEFRFLITEAALRSRICPPPVLRAQLDRLLAITTLDNIELSVLPLTTQLPYPTLHGFWIYDDKLVLVDTVTAELALRDTDDITLYGRLYTLLWQTADHDDQALAIIHRILEELRENQ